VGLDAGESECKDDAVGSAIVGKGVWGDRYCGWLSDVDIRALVRQLGMPHASIDESRFDEAKR
jgi:hypothetical protein